MSYQTVWEPLIAEGTTPRIKGVLKDHAGVGIPATSLTTLRLVKLYDRRSKETINNKADVDIKGTNGGSVDESGNLVLKLAKEDTVVRHPGRGSEVHVALIKFTWDSGNEVGYHEVVHTVGNLEGVP
jgi:hypothetical protein